MELNVLVDPKFKNLLPTTWLRKVLKAILTREGISGDIELGLFISGQDKIRELNQKYRGRNEPTDVLAFASEEGAGFRPFIEPPDGVRRLGEVIVSYPQAAIQAGEHNHSVEKEIAILIIHGVLHLLGYDHDESENEQKMMAREEEILDESKGLVE